MRYAWFVLLFPVLSLGLTGLGCDDDETQGGDGASDSGSDSADLGDQTMPYETISAYNFWEGDPVQQVARQGVIPFDVNVQLWADHAVKFRFIVLPEGGQITYHPDDVWEFPRGTIFVKTFGHYRDLRDPSAGWVLHETRLIINTEDGWTPISYQWNAEQTEAVRQPIGADFQTTFIDESGATVTLDYHIPNVNECRRCHGSSPTRTCWVRIPASSIASTNTTDRWSTRSSTWPTSVTSPRRRRQVLS
jgi:hypothetical protein